MKRFLLFAISAVFAAQASGQSIGAFKTGLLSPDPLTGKSASAQEHGSAATAINSMSAAQQPSTFSGYRVCIFSDNTQNARSASEAAMLRFKEQFPYILVQRGYTEPSYRVTVGCCVKSEEALVLWGKVKGSFDKAFIVRDEIELSEIAEYYPVSERILTED